MPSRDKHGSHGVENRTRADRCKLTAFAVYHHCITPSFSPTPSRERIEVPTESVASPAAFDFCVRLLTSLPVSAGIRPQFQQATGEAANPTQHVSHATPLIVAFARHCLPSISYSNSCILNFSKCDRRLGIPFLSLQRLARGSCLLLRRVKGKPPMPLHNHATLRNVAKLETFPKVICPPGRQVRTDSDNGTADCVMRSLLTVSANRS